MNMKKIKSIILFSLVVSLFFLGGCKKDLTSEGVSFTTNYPTFTVPGDLTIYHQLGQAYTDPGATATENGSPLTVSVSVSSEYTGYSGTTVNANQADLYTITYTATNKDSFSGSKKRTVYVYNTGDLVNSIEGLYSVSVVRSDKKSYSNLSYIMIYKTGTNTYSLSDDIGGYYDLGRALGSTYRGSGVTITANSIPNNDFSFTTGTVGSFGGNVTINTFTVDPATKTIVYTSTWDQGYSFTATLKQVQI